MNYVNVIKEIVAGKLPAETIRAGVYARVSTDNDSQKESCTNQVALAKSYVENHPNISIKDIYIDDGISGKSDYNRPEYNRMLQDVEAGKLDLIIVKSMSRLNRDELNSLALISLLREKEATILTLEDSFIHDFEDRKERIFNSLKFAMDADYVSDQSEKGRLTHKLRCERKELSAKDISFGYVWNRETKTICVNPEEAEDVNLIFEDYVFRNGTPSSIKRIMDQKGRHLSEKTISNILKDERYIGHFYINKRTSKLGTGKAKSKRIALPKEEWILVEREDLQIIDSELFEMAQRIRNARKTTYVSANKETTQAHFRGTHLFAGKIFCACCGRPYHFGYSDRKETIPVYRVKSHSDCAYPAGRISEKDMEEITRRVLQTAIAEQKQVCSTLEQILTECVEASMSDTESIEGLKKKKTSLERKVDSLIDSLMEGGLNDAAKKRIKTKINNIENNIADLTDTIIKKEALEVDDSFVQNKIDEIKDALDELRKFTTIDRDRVLNYVERIDVYENGDMDMTLKSGKTIKITSVLPVNEGNGDMNTDEIIVGKTGIQDGLYSWPAAYLTSLRRVLLQPRSWSGAFAEKF